MEQALLDEFMIEAVDMFEEAERNLLKIEKGAPFADNYNGIFRAFHSLKGASGMFGLVDLERHMHTLESLFEKRKSAGYLTRDQIDFFLRGLDGARGLLNAEELRFDYTFPADDAPSQNTNRVEQKTSSPKSSITSQNIKPVEMPFRFSPQTSILFLGSMGPTLPEIFKKMELNFSNTLDPTHLKIRCEEDKPFSIILSIESQLSNWKVWVEECRRYNPKIPLIGIVNDYDLSPYSTHLYFCLTPQDIEQTLPWVLKNAIENYQRIQFSDQLVNHLFLQFSEFQNYLKAQQPPEFYKDWLKKVKTLLAQKKNL